MALLYVVVSGVVLAAVALITVFILRLFGILRHASEYKPGQKGSVSLLVIAGSGGHTTEIVRLMGSLSQSYNPRHYVTADTDKMSEEKIRTFEAEQEKSGSPSQFTIHRIPRSREVRQSWSSSVLSSLSALISSVPLVFRLQPDIVLCNGPGTCVPLCAAGLLLGVLGLKRVLIIYVESICRVETLSLSGKILYYFSDYFFVQWASLKDKYPKAIYLGRLV
ncbi:UDP-N-acetylglucosamine transferase subunit ALG14 homolog isoform X2 [Sinocyclocheilus anshuiensis]|uniref:UDP-N-acetylglucosamine transferase subunit ALG14 n=1 Tax=Sinocyclocheilus anshuiensis TaxID=1608454 RepID=A0A671P2G9_9TELE|nr:PREDICTED: UDP-N-acetylglucosamine transferase subunit ALG14 homolog isoform X1 [Sinocyclocheilus anshuiensis]XP_016327506.1 PREDICTED: UDP-N-acetylglucosamine transferase subunit ALG14 homolog isoform X2 [Sinocyclocheilus anshuiensis]